MPENYLTVLKRVFIKWQLKYLTVDFKLQKTGK